MSKSLLVLGGTGFIGKHVTIRALKEGYKTFVLCRNYPINDKKVEGIEYLEIDLTKPTDIEKIRNYCFNFVINLSGDINHSDMSNGGNDVIKVHLNGLIELISNLSKDGLESFLQIGSSDEYGNINSPQNEAMREEPISPYSLGKLACTNLLRMLYVSEKLPVVIVRLFLVYGEGQGFNRFLPQIIKGCLKNEEFPTSEGNQIRDFCYVSDIVDGIIATMESEQVNGHILNPASGEPIKIKNVIGKVLDIVGSGNPRFGEIKYRSEENLSLYADISKAQKLISWKPKIDFDIGLKKTIDYYSKIIK